MGAIRKRGDSYHAQVRIKGWQSFTKTFPTKSLAKRWIEKTEAQLREHPIKNETGDDVTLADACTRYINEITRNHKGYAPETARLKFLAQGVLGNTGLRYLSTAQINAYFQKRAREVQEGTLRKEFILLRKLFTTAISTWNLSIPENPMAHLPVPKDSLNRERRITVDEWNKIITVATQMRNPLVKAVVRFAYETGMRRSEILRLRWDDIDGNICTIRNTKNGADRVIPLSRKKTYFDLSASEVNELHKILDDQKAVVESEDSSVKGFNIGANVNEVSGQTVPHFHLHLIPRRNGDMDDPRGGVRGVIPEKQKY